MAGRTVEGPAPRLGAEGGRAGGFLGGLPDEAGPPAARGRSPHRTRAVSSRDVSHQNFESYKPEVQELICVADRLGSLMQYETPGFLPNKRIHRGASAPPGMGRPPANAIS